MKILVLLILMIKSTSGATQPATTQPAAELLAALLPKEVAGLTQDSCFARSDKGNHLGVAVYVSRRSPKQLALICTQYADADAAAAANGWFAQDVNKSTEISTRRTARIVGYRSMEEYDAAARSGSIAIRLSDTTVLVMLYDNLDEPAAIAAAESLPLKLLAATGK